MAKGDPRLEAFPVWEMGQVLLPVQFKALQQALLSTDAVRAELQGLPAYGVSRLQLYEGMLEQEGSISIERLTYVSRFPAPIIDIPGNTVVDNLNVQAHVDEALAKGGLDVYLHVFDDALDTSTHKQGPYFDEDKQRLRRRLFRAALSTKSELDERQGIAKILLFKLEYEPEPSPRWRVGDFSPALLRVGGDSTPFLSERLTRIRTTLQDTLGQIEQNIKDGELSREHIAGLRRVRGHGLRLLARFRDLGLYTGQESQLSAHPYELFRELRDFALETSSTLEEPYAEDPVYDHDEPDICFAALERAFDSLVQEASLSTNALRLEQDADNYYLDDLPRSVGEAREVFLVVRFGREALRPRTASEQLALLDHFKLTSPRESVNAVTHGIPGVPLELLEGIRAEALAHRYGRDALICSLGISEDEQQWQAIREEQALRVPITDARLDDLAMHLVWRKQGPRDRNTRVQS